MTASPRKGHKVHVRFNDPHVRFPLRNAVGAAEGVTFGEGRNFTIFTVTSTAARPFVLLERLGITRIDQGVSVEILFFKPPSVT